MGQRGQHVTWMVWNSDCGPTNITQPTSPNQEFRRLMWTHVSQNQLTSAVVSSIVSPTSVSRFQSGRLLACIASRPGQCGRADGYVLEGEDDLARSSGGAVAVYRPEKEKNPSRSLKGSWSRSANPPNQTRNLHINVSTSWRHVWICEDDTFGEKLYTIRSRYDLWLLHLGCKAVSSGSYPANVVVTIPQQTSIWTTCLLRKIVFRKVTMYPDIDSCLCRLVAYLGTERIHWVNCCSDEPALLLCIYTNVFILQQIWNPTNREWDRPPASTGIGLLQKETRKEEEELDLFATSKYIKGGTTKKYIYIYIDSQWCI